MEIKVEREGGGRVEKGKSNIPSCSFQRFIRSNSSTAELKKTKKKKTSELLLLVIPIFICVILQYPSILSCSTTAHSTLKTLFNKI